jgi:hypothetical protein
LAAGLFALDLESGAGVSSADAELFFADDDFDFFERFLGLSVLVSASVSFDAESESSASDASVRVFLARFAGFVLLGFAASTSTGASFFFGDLTWVVLGMALGLSWVVLGSAA